MNFNFFRNSGWVIDLGYCDAEWFVLEMNQGHPVVFDTAPNTVFWTLLLTTKFISFILRDSYGSIMVIWILVSPPLSTPAQGREIWRAASVEMNHSSQSALFPDVCVGCCPHHLFWALLKGMCPASLLGIQNRAAFEELYVLPEGHFSSAIQRTSTFWQTLPFIFSVFSELQ